MTPLKKLGAGDGGAFILIFRKCIANLQCKNEYVTVIDIQALSYSHMTLSGLTKYCCCFVIFGLTTNTGEMYHPINQSTKFAYRPYKIWTAVLNNVKN